MEYYVKYNYKYCSLRSKFCLCLEKSNFLMEYHFMLRLSNIKIHVSKTTVLNINYSERGALTFYLK